MITGNSELGFGDLLGNRALCHRLWYPARACIWECLPLHPMQLPHKPFFSYTTNQGLISLSLTISISIDGGQFVPYISISFLMLHANDQDKPIYHWLEQIYRDCQKWVLRWHAVQDEIWRRRVSWEKVFIIFPHVMEMDSTKGCLLIYYSCFFPFG